MKIKDSLPHILILCPFALIAVFHGWLALSGLQGPACPNGLGCYPWNAEGPTAGAWRYASKENYALVNFAQMAAALICGLILVKYINNEAKSIGWRVIAWLLVGIWAALFLL
jgi:hypothetical protein